MKERMYHGHRASNGDTTVNVNENDRMRALPEKFDLVNHSPTGFEWGYPGSGPSQLAFAMLFDALDGDVARVRQNYHPFKDAVIARLSPTWALSKANVVRWVEEWEARHKRPADDRQWQPGDKDDDLPREGTLR